MLVTLSSVAMAFMQIGVASESFTPETQKATFMKMYNEGGTTFARKEFYFNSWPVVSVFFFISDSLLKYYFTTTGSMQTHVWGFLIFDRRSFSQLSFTLLWVLVLLLILPGHLSVHLKIDRSNENPPGGKEWGYGQICVFRQERHIFDLSLSFWKGNTNSPVQMGSTQQQQWFGFCPPQYPVICVFRQERHIFSHSLCRWSINSPVQKGSTQQDQCFGFGPPRHPVIK